MLKSFASARTASAVGKVSSLSTCLVARTASTENEAIRLASPATKSSSSTSGNARLIQPSKAIAAIFAL
jgi:hypothetical protein